MASIVAPNTDPGFKGGPDEVAPPATFEQSFEQPFEQTELEKTRLSRASPSAVCVSDFPATAESKTTAHEGKADAHVAFGSVHVRLYLSGLSDHPCVSSGVPVGLTDDFLERDEVSLDDHEIECSNSPPRPWMHVATLSQAQRWVLGHTILYSKLYTLFHTRVTARLATCALYLDPQLSSSPSIFSQVGPLPPSGRVVG